jgi:Xaa-Pro aminopeptidase
MRQTMLDAGLHAWFQPSITIQAPDERWDNIQRTDDRRMLIQPGDLLHCDMGFYYLGLATDQQQNAYILKPGETEAPPGLTEALAAGNRLQDILMRAMVPSHTGNTVLREALADARDTGLEPSIYSHPLGYHGHAAGPTIGLWDRQDGVPGNGDYPLYDNTCYSIELNVRHPVPEWGGQEVRIALEEDAILTGGAVSWLAGRQTQLHIV